MALTLDRSTLALDGRKLMLHVGPVPVLLAESRTEAKADELHGFLESGRLDRLFVREEEMRVNTRWELAVMFAGDPVQLAVFASKAEADLWPIVAGDGPSPAWPVIAEPEVEPEDVPALPEPASGPQEKVTDLMQNLMDSLDPRAQRSA